MGTKVIAISIIETGIPAAIVGGISAGASLVSTGASAVQIAAQIADNNYGGAKQTAMGLAFSSALSVGFSRAMMNSANQMTSREIAGYSLAVNLNAEIGSNIIQNFCR